MSVLTWLFDGVAAAFFVWLFTVYVRDLRRDESIWMRLYDFVGACMTFFAITLWALSIWVDWPW